MHIFHLLPLFLSLSQSSPVPFHRPQKPPAFLLAGDSTTAPRGGWGDAFLSLLTSPATGTNYARSGRTTVDFRSGGYWDDVLEGVAALNSTHKVFVTIQFGHNDQKAEKNITIADFKANLKRMVGEVRAAGGSPILVSSLTRRTFSGGKVIENLAEHSAAALEVAATEHAASIDLNRKSTDYVNAIGQANADLYNLATAVGASKDRTHLNEEGSVLFGTMVAGLLREKRLGDKYLKIDKQIWGSIQNGTFILPEV